MAGGRPSKPIQLVKGHRTKAEKEIREQAESQLLTGISLKASDDVKNNTIAYKEFKRIQNLLKAIDKDDDLSGHVINQHCMLAAECYELAKTRKLFEGSLEKFEDRLGEGDIAFTEEMNLRTKLQKSILDVDKALMAKRKMLLDIAKENLLTIQSALRSVPKKPTDETESDPMVSFMSQRG